MGARSEGGEQREERGEATAEREPADAGVRHRAGGGDQAKGECLVVEFTEQSGLGEIYLTALLRAQLRLSLAILVAVGGILVGLPALFLLVPGAAAATLGPVPVIWLVAGVAVYPIVLLAARLHVRMAERIERDFTDLMAGR